MQSKSTSGVWCERLYDERAAGLLLYGRALGLSHGEAEDVLQETFLGMLQLEGGMPAKPEHYLFRSYRNRALNHRRSLWRRLTRELQSGHWFDQPERPTAREQQAMRALETLPREQRETIVLRIWNGLTYEAIGELLAISPNTAAGRYRYGLEKLRALMATEDYEQLDDTAGEAARFLATSAPIGGS